jgi:hypothetical protein
MEDTLAKTKNQTIWYENDELIREYLDSAKNVSKLETVGPKEKLSIFKLIKDTMADQPE